MDRGGCGLGGRVARSFFGWIGREMSCFRSFVFLEINSWSIRRSFVVCNDLDSNSCFILFISFSTFLSKSLNWNKYFWDLSFCCFIKSLACFTCS